LAAFDKYELAGFGHHGIKNHFSLPRAVCSPILDFGRTQGDMGAIAPNEPGGPA
jgi:hypothetical protein